MKILLLSFWRNDAEQQLVRRVEHLLQKTSKHKLRWLWIVGDSTDGTYELLRQHVSGKVEIVNVMTGIEGEAIYTRRQRLSQTATHAFEWIPDDVDYVCLHESDLISPQTIVDDLLESGHLPVAAWPVIRFEDGTCFYDIWAFRRDGVLFKSRPPYHACYTPLAPFQVDSFGSCWIAPAELVKDRVIQNDAIVELCTQWRREGISLWVDPRVIVEQPVDLWTAQPLR